MHVISLSSFKVNFYVIINNDNQRLLLATYAMQIAVYKRTQTNQF